VADAQGMFTIGQIAARTGLRASSIRHWESVGVLAAPERVSGSRRYGEGVIRQIQTIRVAQQAGFTLAEIRELLSGVDGEGRASARIRALAERKLREVEALIERATTVRGWLEVAMDCSCPTLDDCSLFSSGFEDASNTGSCLDGRALGPYAGTR
jgi:MerR family redox-sensitive transcriptional activator SoxR